MARQFRHDPNHYDQWRLTRIRLDKAEVLLRHDFRLIAAEFLAGSLGAICTRVVTVDLGMNMFMM